jgi:hypothetical protein
LWFYNKTAHKKTGSLREFDISENMINNKNLFSRFKQKKLKKIKQHKLNAL